MRVLWAGWLAWWRLRRVARPLGGAGWPFLLSMLGGVPVLRVFSPYCGTVLLEVVAADRGGDGARFVDRWDRRTDLGSVGDTEGAAAMITAVLIEAEANRHGSGRWLR